MDWTKSLTVLMLIAAAANAQPSLPRALIDRSLLPWLPSAYKNPYFGRPSCWWEDSSEAAWDFRDSLASDLARERVNHCVATGWCLLDPHFILAGRKKPGVAEQRTISDA